MFASGREGLTICAMASPPGRGGVSVIRVSGPSAVVNTRKICPFLPIDWESHRLYYGFARELGVQEQVDEVLVATFSEGKSFTGEETAEITCHGSPVIVEELLHSLVRAGCFTALPGEFTYRAFMNGRIDLVQAESVLSLIESETRLSARMALRQLRGEVSERLNDIGEDLTWIGANLEASIDFSSEDIEVFSTDAVLARVTKVSKGLNDLIASYQLGRQVRDGIKVVLVGRPNVGKSSLLNRILQEERAIVTAIPGTTRDLVKGEVFINGTRFQFTDTAGMRSTEDVVENLGIEKAHNAVEEADLVIFVIDGQEGCGTEDLEVLLGLGRSVGSIVFNKMDCVDTSLEAPMRGLPEIQRIGICSDEGVERTFFVSAKTGYGMESLMAMLGKLGEVSIPETAAVISNVRHYEALVEALACVGKVSTLIRDGMSPEFPAFEVLSALRKIHEVQGKEFDDEIMDRVFREFCIGK